MTKAAFMLSVLSAVVALAGCAQKDDAETLRTFHAQLNKAFGHEYECTSGDGDWAYICEAVGVPVDAAHPTRLTSRRVGAYVYGEYQGRRVFAPLLLPGSGPIPTREQAMALLRKQQSVENRRDPALDIAPR